MVKDLDLAEVEQGALRQAQDKLRGRGAEEQGSRGEDGKGTMEGGRGKGKGENGAEGRIVEMLCIREVRSI